MKTNVLQQLFEVVLDRKANPLEGSYTCYLFEKGTDKILKKCGEECSELIIAAKNDNKEEIVMETSDLIYHIMVLLANKGINVEEVMKELEIRTQKQKNLKQFHKTDKNS